MGLLLQGERVQRVSPLRKAIRRLTETPPTQEKTTSAAKAAKPSWLLLFFDTCWVSGLLALTLYISWVYDKLPAGDPVEYHGYAVAFWKVPPLFHSFPREYPPLSIVPFSFTLWPHSSVHYYWVFAGWMGLIVCISYVLFARYLSRGKAMAYVVYLVVGGVGTLLMRFDLLPALATFGALLLAERKHYRWAYAMLAIGVLLKLYPAFLVPVLMAAQWRESAPVQPTPSTEAWGWRQRLESLWSRALESISDYRSSARVLWQRSQEMLMGVGVFALVTLLGFAVPATINLTGTMSEFKYALSRPIQIESVPASLLWLGTFMGFPAQPNHSFLSLNLVGPLDSVIKPLSLLALVGGTAFVCWQVLRGKLSLGQGFVAMIAVVLASNKLLSPQYIIWILPLVAYVEGFDLLWLGVCALTTLIFPFIYQTRHPILLVPTNPQFLPTIALRNTLLVVATVLAIRGRRRAVTPTPEAAPELELAEFGEPLAGRSDVALEGQRSAADARKPLVKTTQ
ncbi:MAG TPA: glycosyltransferase family 87 protein [Ktedonobacterales bacterium]|nr:glycosyltransferase family 87 protein [Ktedonobacterales bacterium]